MIFVRIFKSLIKIDEDEAAQMMMDFWLKIENNKSVQQN